MNSDEKRIALHKASIISNIQATVNGAIAPAGESISIAEFQERLEKGEKFFTPADVEKFQSDVKTKISKIYSPSEKENVLQKGNQEISLLKSVTVENEIGRKFQFFTIGVEKSEE